MIPKFIPPQYFASNRRISYGISLLGATLLLEHEITPVSLHSYTTFIDTTYKRKHEDLKKYASFQMGEDETTWL